MPAAFVKQIIMGFEVQHLESGESVAQHRLGIEVVDLLRSAGTVTQLLRPIALQDDQAVRLHCLAHAPEDERPEIGAGELAENTSDDVEALAAPVPRRKIGTLRRQRGALVLGK